MLRLIGIDLEGKAAHLQTVTLIKKEWAFSVVLLLLAGWFAVVFSDYPLTSSLRADGSIKYEKGLQWAQTGSFYYSYPQSEFDPQERGIAHHLSGAMPHLTEYNKERVITYPESFAILVGLWHEILPDRTIGLISVLFLIIEVLAFLWIARKVLMLDNRLTFLGGLLLLFCSPHYIFTLQLQEVVMASSLFSVAVVLLLKRESSYGHWVLAGLLAALAFSVRQEVVFPALILCVLLYLDAGEPLDRTVFSPARLLRNKKVLVFGLTFLAGFAFYLWYNWILYDAPLGSRYYAVKELDPEISSGWHIFKSILVGHFDPARPVLGLLAQMPFLLLLLALPFWFRHLNREARIILSLGILSAFVIALASPNDSWGGWGQRFTMVVHGPLILGFLALLEIARNQEERKWLQLSALLLVFVTLGGAFWLARFGWKLEKENLRYSTEIQSDLASLNSQAQLSDVPVLSTTDLYYWAGLEYYDRPILQARASSDLQADVEYYFDRLREKKLCCLILHQSKIYRPQEQERYAKLRKLLEAKSSDRIQSIPELEKGTEQFYLVPLNSRP
ncbi:MAG: hypothetical protein KDK23_10230 [Leptospiraceae bacterium]|nr:hypothetical protein [Leptospiraceae bacterium]